MTITPLTTDPLATDLLTDDRPGDRWTTIRERQCHWATRCWSVRCGPV